MMIDYELVFCSSAAVAGTLTVLLVAKSIASFTQTGPEIRTEIRRSYSCYTAYALARLGLFAFVLMFWMALVGTMPVLAGSMLVHGTPHAPLISLAALAGVGGISFLQFCKHLLLIPSSIMMNSNYSMRRFVWLHRLLTVSRLRWLELGGSTVVLAGAWEVHAALGDAPGSAAERLLFLGFCAAVAAPYLLCKLPSPGLLLTPRARAGERMNLLMIGSDTLRADHLGARYKQQPLTPFIDTLAAQGALFTNCLTSIARTAPSLVSIFTGTWPNTNGIKENYNAADHTKIAQEGLGTLLARHGYATAAITDWAGSDLAKFPLGFQDYDGPPDQWNLKFLIRQGPKDLRLFLSLFTHNRLGKALLPELYYLAGKPMTTPLGEQARVRLNRYARSGQPFFLNVFLSTTHPPFGSEYPYYQYFTNPDYRGESAFGMSRLTDPVEIIRSQREPREAFDLDQVLDLYKGCVRNFDNEVRKLVQHLRRTGLDHNTVVVIYSDHGMEFFENSTWGQGNSIYGSVSNRIPLLVMDPRRPEAVCSGRMVRAIDIVPTLLDTLGIDIPDGTDGVSLLPAMQERTAETLPGFCETGLWLATPPGQHPRHIRYPELLDVLDVPCKRSGTLDLRTEYKAVIEHARDRMLELGDWRLLEISLVDGPEYALYHLPTDPGCTTDRADQNPEVVTALKRTLNELARRAPAHPPRTDAVRTHAA